MCKALTVRASTNTVLFSYNGTISLYKFHVFIARHIQVYFLSLLLKQRESELIEKQHLQEKIDAFESREEDFKNQLEKANKVMCIVSV